MAFDWRNPERVVPWKPRQRFRLSALGHDAASRYQSAVRAAQESASQRSELERAKQAWADGLKLRPMDGIVLDELVAGRTSLAEMKETLEACGLTLREARGAIDRLRAAQLVEPLETEGGV
ncbi:MAG: hypothetical protein E6K81_04260 [Candidatus Eisenbacteria bacterium]|uniref:Uncharacterized protein n=1 Tax=Eiseniibacteriota bacterium TaxID=2212470 RepID=A0A538UCA9_UNCEI|nr:MAG: hypothetical protein E6K81_04260 [Candidatus Eisenbacteria bacterium]